MDVSPVLGLSNWMTKGGGEDMETKRTENEVDGWMSQFSNWMWKI